MLPPCPADPAADPSATRAWLVALAHREGFGRVRFARAGPAERPERLERYVAAGRHGELGWLSGTLAARLDTRRVFPSGRTVMVLGIDYAHDAPPDPGGLTGRVSAYAWGRDYHNLVLRRARRLRRLVQEAWPGERGWVGVDSQPTWERAWAEAAGLGFAGKNACLIAPGETSLFFLALVVLTVDVPPDAPLGDHCGSCRRCLDACPTAAFVGPYELDARRCIAYHTIEHDGPIPVELRAGFGTWLFGCDACQEVCPHVRPRVRSRELDFAARHAWIDLPELLAQPDDVVVERFTGTPLRRAAPRRLKRNATVVLGNRGDPAARPALEAVARGSDPLLAEHAAWALDHLG